MKSSCLVILTLALFLGSALAPLLTVEEAEGQVIIDPFISVRPSTLWLDARSPEKRTENITLVFTSSGNHRETWNITIEHSKLRFHIVPDYHRVTVNPGQDVRVNFTVSTGYRILNEMVSFLVHLDLEEQDGSSPAVPYRMYTSFQAFAYDRDLFCFALPETVVKLVPATEEEMFLDLHSSSLGLTDFDYTLLNKKELEGQGIEVLGLDRHDIEKRNETLPDSKRIIIRSTDKLAEPGTHKLFIHIQDHIATYNESTVIRLVVVVEEVNPTVELGIFLLGFLVLLCPFLPAVKRKLGPLVASFRKQCQVDSEEQQKAVTDQPSQEPDSRGGEL